MTRSGEISIRSLVPGNILNRAGRKWVSRRWLRAWYLLQGLCGQTQHALVDAESMNEEGETRVAPKCFARELGRTVFTEMVCRGGLRNHWGREAFIYYLDVSETLP